MSDQNKLPPFLDYLKNHLVVFDGAMGTLIYERGVYIDKCFDALNLTNPQLIRSIHKEYINAGASVIETNTFGANHFKLRRHNIQHDVHQINKEGARIAKETMGNHGYTAGSMGPLGISITPWGDISLNEARDAFHEQASALLEGGIDLFCIETFQNLNELESAIEAIQSISDLPIIAQMALQEDGRTSYGVTLQEFIKRISEFKVACIGFNCALGPKPMLDLLEQMRKMTSLPISVMPNAGLPHYVDGRMFYMSTPDYFGVYAKRFIESGASVIGGCCGTTPDHIQKMADAVTQKQTRLRTSAAVSVKVSKEDHLPDPIPVEKKSSLSKKIFQGDFVILMEMVPPRGRDLNQQMAGAQLLKESGVDAINIPDGPRASARLNGLAMAVHIQDKLGMETVLHYTCRDRSLLGMQSELLGASVLGIKNILAITGDPPRMGDYPQSTPVFDIDSIGLTQLLKNMNLGLDVGLKRIGDPTGFFIGVGVDPNHIQIEQECQRLQRKMDAGAEYIVTQPVFDPISLEKFINKFSDVSVPFISGIWPLASLRNAEFMRNEVPGVSVPDAILQRLARYELKEDQFKIGIEIAQEIVERVKNLTQGIQISAPFGRYKEAIEVARPVIKKA
jgi:methionine synthase I (cobalamin-dependent)/5,10-methylenetetrahydrofolate reductase